LTPTTIPLVCLTVRAISPRAVIVALVSALLATGMAVSGQARTTGVVRACAGKDLAGSFKRIPGGGSLGHVAYRLTARNKTSHKCFVKGLPTMRLLDRHSRSLPTRVLSADGRASKIVLKSGQRAVADANFAEIPTSGDSQSGNCQPTSFKARVGPRPGGGTFVVPVKPHTPVCDRGALPFRPFKRGH
jgi:Protein of unknown function (DUF4232)